ncbi:FGGY family carbohydrate kinase [Hydrogenophaga sp. MI9]|uniref:FGGY family carbohydrate kinase n=1 Tax=Hydrogenophaga sp. MI9 TaxID=3453719 RepID=UPI003EEBAEE8
MSSFHVLAIDQGTSATKCVLVNARGEMVAKASAPLGEHYPAPGWVEQDPAAIWASVREAVRACLALAPDAAVCAVGLSTQRESALVWEREGARALTPLLSWQDQRTVALRDRLMQAQGDDLVRERSGLPLDPMFSALKIRWLLDQDDALMARARRGELCAGTVDAWLVANLGGEPAIEVGNASRTQLLDVGTGRWSPDLLSYFSIPASMMPVVVSSRQRRANADRLHERLAGVPVHGVMADSHAALYAHGVREPGDVKATMGTGSSVMGLAADAQARSREVCQTIAWDEGDGPRTALEGNIRSAGATLKWAAELFGMDLHQAIEEAGRNDPDGLWLVPGFTGLGAPYWDAHAVGLLSGLSFSTGRGQVLAAAVDSIAHQVADVLDAMDRCASPVRRLLLDGGPSTNPELRGRIAAYIGRPVVHCTDPELSALGVAHMAGLGVGLWDADAIARLPRGQNQSGDHRWSPDRIAQARQGWRLAVARARLRDCPNETRDRA